MQELGFTAGELTPEDMQLMKEEKKRWFFFFGKEVVGWKWRAGVVKVDFEGLWCFETQE